MINLELVQQNRKGGNNLFYGRPVYVSTISTDTIAEQVQDACSAKVSDCRAIITEMMAQLNYLLLNSFKIELEDIGMFYLSMKSSGAITDGEYNPAKNVKSVSMNFRPKLKRYGDRMLSPMAYGTSFQVSSYDRKMLAAWNKLTLDQQNAKGGWNKYMGRVEKKS